MRALVIPAAGRGWRVDEVDDPVPGNGQVLVRVLATAICGTDVLLWHGRLPVRFPVVLGHEPVGEVVAVGVAVADRRVGDVVGILWREPSCGLCRLCTSDRPHLCQSRVGKPIGGMGGFADLMAVDADRTIPVPPELDHVQAAPLVCAGGTAHRAVAAVSAMPGDTVTVVGLGGLGHLAVQIAVAAGSRVQVLTSSPEKAKLGLALGAERAVTNGSDLLPANAIVATNPIAARINEAMTALDPGGTVAVVGVLDAPLAFAPAAVPMRWTITGVMQHGKAHIDAAFRLAVQGRIRSHNEVAPLPSGPDLILRVADGTIRHKAVLVT